MSKDTSRKSPVTVTLLIRDDCGGCDALVETLQEYPTDDRMELITINLNNAEPPAFAQGVIVPATYIGKRLWRHGTYTPKNLIDRVTLELQPTD